ncbi:hypothetical protein [Clostridium felsineum]|uniref:Uncharacterized protein n=1 Tax=Clostridium felsineum TaxID=36839 RepID=A0A1S8LJN4_9CLOT|nr:hypothetical protein [Clostridium felsineum]URZ05795.1 hypothetical protein CLROS_011260 [Clostridium felsineum]URZ10834.1 hypothetical protein CROST_015490 [Clostridium felsineum]
MKDSNIISWVECNIYYPDKEKLLKLRGYIDNIKDTNKDKDIIGIRNKIVKIKNRKISILFKICSIFCWNDSSMGNVWGLLLRLYMRV